MRVHIVNTSNIGRYGRQLKQMHEQRKAMFVDRLKWSDIDTGHSLEIDEFDNEYAHYMLLLDDVGSVLASCRMAPTDKPNVSCDVLADYFDGCPPRDQKVWEVSRWIPAPGVPEINQKCSNMMMLALFEFGLSRDLSMMISCVGRIVTRAIAAAKLPLEHISQPIRYSEGVAFGIQFIPSATTLTHLRRHFGIFDAVTVEIGQTETPAPQATALHFSLIENILSVEDETELAGLLMQFCTYRLRGMSPTKEDIQSYISEAFAGAAFQ